MRAFITVFALKIVSLVAALAQTLGVLGVVGIDMFEARKWELLAGGTIVVVISEGLSYWLARRAVMRLDGSR